MQLLLEVANRAADNQRHESELTELITYQPVGSASGRAPAPAPADKPATSKPAPVEHVRRQHNCGARRAESNCVASRAATRAPSVAASVAEGSETGNFSDFSAIEVSVPPSFLVTADVAAGRD